MFLEITIIISTAILVTYTGIKVIDQIFENIKIKNKENSLF